MSICPDLGPFLHLRRHVVVAHHVPGRIRLRLRPSVLSDLPSADPAPFLALLERLPVRIGRVNRAALSVVVEYDPRVVSAGDWQGLLTGPQAAVAAVLNRHLGARAPSVPDPRRALP